MQQPTVQQIAGSFVGQYYNVLLKTPENLYRFYKADSSFVSGFQNETVEPVIGEEVCTLLIFVLYNSFYIFVGNSYQVTTTNNSSKITNYLC